MPFPVFAGLASSAGATGGAAAGGASLLGPIGIGLLAGGALASAGGGILGSSSANRAARTQKQDVARRASYGENIIAQGLYGPQYSIYANELSKTIQSLNEKGDVGQWDTFLKSKAYKDWQNVSGGPVIGQLQTLANRFGAQGNQQLARFDDTSNTLSQQYGGIEALAAQYGLGRDRIIRQDSADELNSLNDQTAALLNARGLGASSTLTNALRSNSERVSRNRDRALQDSADQTAARTIDARKGTVDFNALRDAQRLGLWSELRNQNLSNRLRPITTQLAGNSEIANLWAGAGTPPSSGASGAASALTGLGNTAAQFGSLLAIKDLLG